MWNRKELKQKAKSSIRKHLFRVAAVCFITAFLGGMYQETTGMISHNDVSLESSDTTRTQVIETGKTNAEIVNDLLNGGQVVDISQQKEKYNRGVLAGVFNSVTESGSFLFGLLNSFNEGFFHGHIGYAFIILLGTVIAFIFWFYIANLVWVGQSRFLMEKTLYHETPVKRMLFLFNVRRMTKAAKVMFFKEIYQFFWAFTIIGLPIKLYSYKMVPFIVAENPDVTKKEALGLSRRMMNGNKWKTFVLDLSFLPWMFLNAVTMGLLNLIYLNPYKQATYAELYMELRRRAIADQTEGFELFTDRYLDQVPVAADGTLQDQLYPVELFTIPEHHSRKWINVDYRRKYSLRSILLLFFTFSFVGWVWEVSLHLFSDGQFVNRGVLQGPWLPIYGMGGVLVLVLLKKVRDTPWLTFILTVVVCGVLEYYTSWYLEVTKGAKWWDYSGYLLNINGRVCAEGLLVFGLGGCAFIYFFAPLLDQLYKKISKRVQTVLCIVLVILFVADEMYSGKHPNMGKGITDYQSEKDLDREFNVKIAV